jgi:excisionase family DNA binding protein
MTDTHIREREIFYGARAIAEFLGVSQKTVYELIERRAIPFYKIGNKVCARRSHLLEQADRLVKMPAA